MKIKEDFTKSKGKLSFLKENFCFIYFLLLVQKKVTKKSTPATIYSRRRRLD